MRLRLLTASFQLLSFVHANTEKTIFIAPSSIALPSHQSGLANLCLESLTVSNVTINTRLSVAFPTAEDKRGVQSWFLLNHLNAGKRYEVRVCWVATVCSHYPSMTLGIFHIGEALANHFTAAPDRFLARHIYPSPSLRKPRAYIRSCRLLGITSRHDMS